MNSKLLQQCPYRRRACKIHNQKVRAATHFEGDRSRLLRADGQFDKQRGSRLGIIPKIHKRLKRKRILEGNSARTACKTYTDGASSKSTDNGETNETHWQATA
jgi:hypothetical protein